MKYIKLFEDYKESYLITEFPFMVADKLYTMNIYNIELNEFKQWYGNDETAEYNLFCYINDVNYIYENGGIIYRGLYYDDINTIKGLNPLTKDIGQHWTLHFHTANDILDKNETYYNNGFKNRLIIEAYTPPKNISIKHVDIGGNPNEEEINIIDFSLLEFKKIYNL